MAKIKVSADTVLSILKGIMGDEEVNTTITDTSAPEDWQGKTVQEALNVEYFTFRHRPMDTEYIVKELIAKSQSPSSLLALSRSFCLLYLDDVTRSFSKQNDIVTVTANLEYWLQTDKIKLLEDLVEDMTIGTVGERISVQIGAETRQVVMAFSKLNVTEIQDITEFGEMAICELSVEMIFYPVATSLSDYKVSFLIDNEWVDLPISGIVINGDMTQKSVPLVNRERHTGTINLSKVKTLTLSFDGYKNAFVSYLTSRTLETDMTPVYGDDATTITGFTENTSSDYDNNDSICLRLTRGEDVYYYEFVIKSHQITVQENTENETHSLTLVTRGMK